MAHWKNHALGFVRRAATMLLIATVLVLGIGFSAPSASVSTQSSPSRTVAMIQASPESCATVMSSSAAGGTLGWGVAAVSSVPCGGWMGDLNAGYICWVSQQTWGYWAKALVSIITNGQYDRC